MSAHLGACRRGEIARMAGERCAEQGMKRHRFGMAGHRPADRSAVAVGRALDGDERTAALHEVDEILDLGGGRVTERLAVVPGKDDRAVLLERRPPELLP